MDQQPWNSNSADVKLQIFNSLHIIIKKKKKAMPVEKSVVASRLYKNKQNVRDKHERYHKL